MVSGEQKWTARVALPVLDVGAMSGSSMLISLAGAQALSVNGFGAFGIVFTMANLLLTFAQGGLIDIILQNDESFFTPRRRLIEIRTFAIVLGSALTVPLIHEFRDDVSIIICSFTCMWLYVRHHVTRAHLIAGGREITSLFTSLLLLVTCAVVCVASSVGWIAGSYGFGISCFAALALPAVISGLSFIHREGWAGTTVQRVWNLRYAAESLVLAGGVQLAILIVAPVLGLDFMAGVRGAGLLLGPISMVQSSLRLVLFPRLVQAGARRRFLLRRASVQVAFGSAAWWACAHIILLASGDALLGESSAYVPEVLAWQGCSAVLQGLYLVGFLAARAAKLDMRVTVGRSFFLLGVAGGVIGAIASGEMAPFFIGNIAGQILGTAYILGSPQLRV